MGRDQGLQQLVTASKAFPWTLNLWKACVALFTKGAWHRFMNFAVPRDLTCPLLENYFHLPSALSCLASLSPSAPYISDCRIWRWGTQEIKSPFIPGSQLPLPLNIQGFWSPPLFLKGIDLPAQLKFPGNKYSIKVFPSKNFTPNS